MGASDGGEKRAPPDRRCLFDSAANRTETSFCGVCSRSIKASFFGEQLALVAVPPRRGRDSPLLKTFVRFPRFSFAALFCTAEQASREAPPARPRNAPARRRLATRPAGLSQLARSHRARVSPRPRLRSRALSLNRLAHQATATRALLRQKLLSLDQAVQRKGQAGPSSGEANWLDGEPSGPRTSIARGRSNLARSYCARSVTPSTACALCSWELRGARAACERAAGLRRGPSVLVLLRLSRSSIPSCSCA